MFLPHKNEAIDLSIDLKSGDWFCMIGTLLINTFHATGLCLYTLKTLGNLWGFLIFSGGMERGQWHEMD